MAEEVVMLKPELENAFKDPVLKLLLLPTDAEVKTSLSASIYHN